MQCCSKCASPSNVGGKGSGESSDRSCHSFISYRESILVSAIHFSSTHFLFSQYSGVDATAEPCPCSKTKSRDTKTPNPLRNSASYEFWFPCGKLPLHKTEIHHLQTGIHYDSLSRWPRRGVQPQPDNVSAVAALRRLLLLRRAPVDLDRESPRHPHGKVVNVVVVAALLPTYPPCAVREHRP